MLRFLLYLLVFISFTDLFSQLPIISTYAQSLGATTSLIGLIVGAYSLSNLFSNVLVGDSVDKKGPKIVLIIGFLINGIILFLYSVVTSPVHLLIVRFINGITAGVITPAAFTYISLNNRDGRTGKAMAFSAAAVGLAAILGPAFSGIVSTKYSHEAVYVTMAALMFIGGLIALFLKPHQVNKPEIEKKKKFIIAEYFPLFKNKGLIWAFTGAFSLAASQGILAYMLPLKVRSLNMEPHISGMLMSVFGIVAVLFFILPTNRLFDKRRNETLLAIGLMIIALAQLLNSIFATQYTLMISMGIYGIGFAFIFPSMAALITHYSGTEMRGKAFGLFYGFFSLGSFLGSSITGLFSLNPNQGFIAVVPFLLLSSIIIIIQSRKIELPTTK